MPDILCGKCKGFQSSLIVGDYRCSKRNNRPVQMEKDGCPLFELDPLKETFTVKPLVWNQFPHNPICYHAESLIGRYSLFDLGNSQKAPYWYLSGHRINGFFVTDADAKAAAEAHWQKTIREYLVPVNGASHA